MDFEEDEDDAEGQKKQKGPKFPLTMFIFEGLKYYNLNLFNKAIASYSYALEKEPQDVRSLIGRAKCFQRLGRLSDAKKDAEDALEANSKSPEAKRLKAEIDYLLGDFENAFITYNRGQGSRPNFGAFRLGEQMCKRAIDNTLGIEKDLLFNKEDVEEVAEHLEISPQEMKDIEKPNTTKVSKLYADDVKFLRTILTDKTLKSVHPDCGELLEFVKDRQRFWRTQNPDTQRKYRYQISWSDFFPDSSSSGKSWYSSEAESESTGSSSTGQSWYSSETESNYTEENRDEKGHSA